MTIIKGHPLAGWAVWRIKKNKNCIIVVNGQTGSGKSYACLDLAINISEKLKTKFSIKDNLDFKFTKLLKKSMLPQNQKPGTVFVFEETGVMGGGGSSRDWQSRANKFFLSFLQTTRHRNQVLIFNCPMFSFLDAGARSLVHMQIIMQRIDFKNKKSYMKPYLIQSNQRTGKPYFKLLRFTIDGDRHKLVEQEASYPPKEMVKEYEAMKTNYTSELVKSILEDEKKSDEKNKGAIVDNDMVEALLDKGFNTRDIADKLNVNIRTIQRHKNELEAIKNPLM